MSDTDLYAGSVQKPPLVGRIQFGPPTSVTIPPYVPVDMGDAQQRVIDLENQVKSMELDNAELQGRVDRYREVNADLSRRLDREMKRNGRLTGRMKRIVEIAVSDA